MLQALLLAVVVVIYKHLQLVVQVDQVVVVQELVVMALQELPTLAVAVVAHNIHQVQVVVQVVLVLWLSVILDHQKVLAELLHSLADIPTIISTHLVHLSLKEKIWHITQK
jgi:hypothetical protein